MSRKCNLFAWNFGIIPLHHRSKQPKCRFCLFLLAIYGRIEYNSIAFETNLYI